MRNDNRFIQTKHRYRRICYLIALLLCIVIPSALLSPFLFDNMPFQLLSHTVKVISIISLVIGLWFMFVSQTVIYQDKKFVNQLSQGMELIILIIPYVLVRGTYLFFKYRR
ncbi:MAG: hypothetical protein HWE27_08330 [Gammaproteobacteria bacterium]|nr:hypothetical protein [Gammaproteobacteria bacterium]